MGFLKSKGLPMTSRLAKLRHSAFQAQVGLCFYCGLPMWESNPEAFAHALGLTLPQAHRLQATAEHLHARCDGGLDARDNIVAACRHCNQMRHESRKNSRDWKAYRRVVATRMTAGAWFDRAMITRLWRAAMG